LRFFSCDNAPLSLLQNKFSTVGCPGSKINVVPVLVKSSVIPVSASTNFDACDIFYMQTKIIKLGAFSFLWFCEQSDMTCNCNCHGVTWATMFNKQGFEKIEFPVFY